MAKCPTCTEQFDTEMGVKVHHALKHGESIAKIEKLCENCDQIYELLQWKDNSNNGQKYCSRECMYDDALLEGKDHPQWDGGPPTFECDQCGQTFERWKDKRENRNIRFCSRDCYGQWMHENKPPEDTNFYKGGVSWGYYYGRHWEPMREKALERDDFECQRCGTTGDLHVHHKTPVRKYLESNCHQLKDAHDLDNLITLCPSCHAKVEVNLPN